MDQSFEAGLVSIHHALNQLFIRHLHSSLSALKMNRLRQGVRP